MSTDYHVIDHHHDADAGLYRLVIGTPEEITRPALDENGEPVLEPRPLLNELGEPVLDVDGKEVVLAQSKLETVTHYPAREDFVFADDDERWQGKEPEEVAKEQRADVRKQLRERERQNARDAELRAQRLQLPGSGQAL